MVTLQNNHLGLGSDRLLPKLYNNDRTLLLKKEKARRTEKPNLNVYGNKDVKLIMPEIDDTPHP